mgnify:FL=1
MERAREADEDLRRRGSRILREEEEEADRVLGLREDAVGDEDGRATEELELRGQRPGMRNSNV